jgi:stalled ribosome rescue protein Dom34
VHPRGSNHAPFASTRATHLDRVRPEHGALPAALLVMPKHVAVWMDHKEAHVFEIQPEKVSELVVAAPHHIHHRHVGGAEGVKGHPEDAKRFFHEVAHSLEGVERILVVGPSTAKLEFLKYVHAHAHALAPKIIGIETVDHPTDGQLIAYAKTYFDRAERMQNDHHVRA